MKTLLLNAIVALSLVCFASAQSEIETAWEALVTEHKTMAKAAKEPEALALYEQIMEAETLSVVESVIVAEVAKALGGEERYIEAYSTLALSNKTGEGVTRVKATLKFLENDPIGWTQEMVASRFDLACVVAKNNPQSVELLGMVHQRLLTVPAIQFNQKKLFKEYRATLPKAQQIVITAAQKNLVLALVNRNSAANSWLAEVSADLIALQLEQ
jgi:hypothetical protein